MFFYRGRELFAARLGALKAHYVTQSGYGGDEPEPHEPPLLYDLEADPAERFDVASARPEALEEIRARVQAHQEALAPGEDLLSIRLEPGAAVSSVTEAEPLSGDQP
jgi:hypothetical protein